MNRDPISLETAERMLSFVRGVESRDVWVKMAYVLRDEFGDVAFDIWDHWSQGAPNYNAKDARDVWKSCKGGTGARATIGALVALAKEGGYKPTAQDRKPIDPEELKRLAEERAARLAAEQAERAAAAEQAAAKAAKLWEAATPDRAHPYLARKQIPSTGARVLRDQLLVPMRHGPGALVGLQVIQADGSRKFLTGTPAGGAYTTLGKPSRTGWVVICEGYATGVSIHLATGYCVVVAFSAGNLQAVATKIRAALPEAALVLAADDDFRTEGNPGITSADQAARAIRALVAIPRWLDDRGNGTDFNDLHALEGLDAVTEQILAAQPPKPHDEVGNKNPIKKPVADPANDNMPAPLNIFAEFPAPPIARDMLPAAVADYAFDCGELIGVTPSMVAIPALVACASALHDDVKIQPKRHETGWTESARLWCAIVGSPSVKKSPAIRRATRRLRKIDKDLNEENARQAAEHAVQMDAYKEAKKEAKKSGGSIPEPKRPAMMRMLVEDITVEALSDVLKDNSRGVLCIQDELSGWFGSMDAYTGGKSGNKDRAAWLQAYDGGYRQVDRVMRGAISIPNFSVSMIGGIQPDAIRRIAKDMTDDGLMQRFMIVIGGNETEHDRPENSDANRAFADLVDHLHAVQGSGEPVRLSDQAHAVRERVLNYANELADYPALPGGLRSHLGKWSGLFARLLLTYHAIECAAQRTHPVEELVSGATAVQVERLMTRFLLPHSLAYYTDVLGASGDLEHARWIAGHILSKGLLAISNRDLVQAYKQWRGLDDWRRQRVMQLLEDMSWVAPVIEEGRPSKRGATSWSVNPQVHDAFAEKAQAESERRDRIRAEIAAMQRPA